MCPDGVVAYHESLSSFRPGSESRSGRLFTGKKEDFEKVLAFLYRFLTVFLRLPYNRWVVMVYIKIPSASASITAGA
jgi:hypothetical protein